MLQFCVLIGRKHEYRCTPLADLLHVDLNKEVLQEKGVLVFAPLFII